MISLKQLTYALAVKHTKHFKHAAEYCSVSQSTLSAAISELETQLRVSLFERDNKKVLITPLGEQILAKAEQIMIQVHDLEHLAKQPQAPLSQPMKMGIIPTISPYLLSQVLPALRQSHPNFELTLIEEPSLTLINQVKSGQLDSAIIALPYPLDGLLSFIFWEEDFYAVCHTDAPLASKKILKQEDLQDEPLLLLKEGHCLTTHALSVCNMHRPKQDHAFEGTSLFTLIQMVAGKMGTTLIPKMAIKILVENQPELKVIHLDEPGPHRQIAFIVRPNYTNLNSIEALKNKFIDVLSKAE